MQKLIELVQSYCEKKNLIYSAYMEGLLNGGPLSDRAITTLTNYHKDWLAKS